MQPSMLIVINQRQNVLQNLIAGPPAPDLVAHDILTLFRKAQLKALQPILPSEFPLHRPPLIQIGNSNCEESGPLATLAPLLSVGARRTLPGHLLRRSQILSSLRSDTAYFLRTAITSCTGEEVVLDWTLKLIPGTCGDQWILTSIETDHNIDRLPTTPHPRVSPEQVVLAQLHALKRNEIYEAASWNCWRRSSGRFGIHFKLLSQLVQQEPYSALIGYENAQLEQAALPSQRHQLQQVVIEKNSSGCDIQRFVWKLAVQDHGCWMVTGIEPL